MRAASTYQNCCHKAPSQVLTLSQVMLPIADKMGPVTASPPIYKLEIESQTDAIHPHFTNWE